MTFTRPKNERGVSPRMNAQLLQQFHEFQENVVLETSDHALSTINDMVDADKIDLAPQFQRRDRWEAERQSSLIESFILNIPVPPVYLAERDQGRYDVIDGKQRLTAIKEFLSGTLRLRGLERFTDLNGTFFETLPADVQSALNFRPLRTVTLLRQSSPEAKYEVFHRLNTGGQVLNAQEIRNVLYRGDLNDLIYRLAEEQFLRTQLKVKTTKSSPYMRMTDAEWVLRFFCLSESWRSFEGDFRRSMDSFMAHNQNASKAALADLEAKFISALSACQEIFGARAFKRWDGTRWRDQAMAAIFDAQMVACSELESSTLRGASSESEEIMDSFALRLTENPDLDEAVRRSTNTPSRVRLRVQEMIDIIAGKHR